MNTRIHMGIRFDVWNSQRGWFWCVVDSRHEAGVIGAAPREADAIQEACWSIEEMSSSKKPLENPPPNLL